VTTANPGDETYVYMHLDEVADIDEGDQLETGDLIGYVGNTGNAAGGPAHLHFELRENRRASNPLPRLTDEFSLQEKMRFVENMLDEVRNDEELATFLAGEYLGEFVRAQAQGISIPRLVAERLPGSLADGSSPSRDLTIESEGVDVSVLQSILIAKGHLAIDAPTGYFGPLTEAALALYQRENGISPAAGYFGPITRAHMFGVSQATSLAVRRAELQQTLDKLLLQVEALQRELAALSS
jgi:hypothetical protein